MFSINCNYFNNLHFVIFQVYILLYYPGEAELNFIIKNIIYEEKFDFFM